MKSISFHANSEDVLKYRRNAFLFILLLIIFMNFIFLFLGFISFYLFLLINFFLAIMFYDTYYRHPISWKLDFYVNDKIIRTGFFSYKWHYFRSFEVVHEKDKCIILLKGFLFDYIFPIVIPVKKSICKKVLEIVKSKIREENSYKSMKIKVKDQNKKLS